VRPLAGRRVLVLRAEGQGERSARILRERGAEPVVIPSIEIAPPDDLGPLQRAVASLSSFDWVVVTSANGVTRLFAAIQRTGAGVGEALGRAKVAVVGTATAEALSAAGVRATLVAKEFRGEALAADLLKQLNIGSSVVLFRAQDAPDALPHALTEAGVRVEVVPTYKTRAAPEGAREIARRLQEHTLDAVIFTSGSTVDAICDATGPAAKDLLAATTVACIGPVTLARAVSRGLRVDVTPRVATFSSAVDALEEHFRGI
jgi:uroporphyrinogen-III synthase